jgi:hypothetical protein
MRFLSEALIKINIYEKSVKVFMSHKISEYF